MQVQASGLLDAALVDDKLWPAVRADNARLELECVHNATHVSFACAPLLSSADVRASNDPLGLARFWNLAQDAAELFDTLLKQHFKAKPTPF